jgi:hypothetical protein
MISFWIQRPRSSRSPWEVCYFAEWAASTSPKEVRCEGQSFRQYADFSAWCKGRRMDSLSLGNPEYGAADTAVRSQEYDHGNSR